MKATEDELCDGLARVITLKCKEVERKDLKDPIDIYPKDDHSRKCEDRALASPDVIPNGVFGDVSLSDKGIAISLCSTNDAYSHK